jgi:hypothetical protein
LDLRLFPGGLLVCGTYGVLHDIMVMLDKAMCWQQPWLMEASDY